VSAFLSPLRTELVDEIDDIHVLLEPLVYQSDLLQREVVVPKDFRTDFASVPRVIGAYLLFGGKGKRAAVVHDFLYSGGIEVSREMADAVFKEALLASGHSAFTAWAMHAGVRVGGEGRFTGPSVPQPPHVAGQMEAP
jgi:hypothetical protein